MAAGRPVVCKIQTLVSGMRPNMVEDGCDESCAIYDSSDGSIVAVVLRGVMGEGDELQREFLSWAVETIQNGIVGRRSIRVSTRLHTYLN